VAEIKRCHEKMQPVLVGTITVEKSEELSKLLVKEKVPHNVLNAKNHKLEAEIIAQAGESGKVTISTNMAGRGTDILLGGNPEFLTKQKLKNLGYPDEIVESATSFEKNDDPQILKAKDDYAKYYELFKKDTDKEKEEVIAAGGLRIIGTERHESRRIDNQLRGRSGRQGDIGSSVFFLSMEDDVMRIFGGETMQNITQKLSLDPDQPITAKLITRQIENAQARVEDRNLSVRKHVLGYDDVMNVQRKVIYNQRLLVLDGMNVHEQIIAMIRDLAALGAPKYVDFDIDHREWDYTAFNGELESCLLENGTNLVTPDFVVECEVVDTLIAKIAEVAISQYEAKRKFVINDLGADFDKSERDCLLYNVDTKWMEHIDNMDELKQGISLVAYAQQDPVMVYKKEGFDMFEEMVAQIGSDTVKCLCKSRFEKTTQTAVKEKTDVKTNEDTTAGKKKSTVGRNAPCPCGSGKKYKNCCGKND
ncbi:MAG: SEC-C metal-binding domain-containing protein, partial [Clostridia bacterium]